MIGAIELVSVRALSVRSVSVYPAADRHSARVVAVLVNTASAVRSGPLSARLFKEKGDRCLAEARTEVRVAQGAGNGKLTLTLAGPAEVWDEFSPVAVPGRSAVRRCGRWARRGDYLVWVSPRRPQRIDAPHQRRARCSSVARSIAASIRKPAIRP